MKSIKMPFGLNSDGNLVHISEVVNGKKCDCICPSCKAPLTAAKGNIKQHHFKHAIDSGCESGLESSIHLAAKEIIKEKKTIKLPENVLVLEKKDSKGLPHHESTIIVEAGLLIKFDFVEEEKIIDGMIVDLLAKKQEKQLIIEIYFRHNVDDEKIQKIKNSNISAIELDLSNLSPEDLIDRNTFWNYINNPERAQWLYNSTHQDEYLKLQKNLDQKIEKKEQEYIKEREKEMKRLTRSIEEVKRIKEDSSLIINLDEFKNNFNLYSRNIPKFLNLNILPDLLNLSELPDFINLKVQDGDWIYGSEGCVWQLIVYSMLYPRVGEIMTIKFTDKWLKKILVSKVHNPVKNISILRERFPEIVSSNLPGDIPNTWKTLRTYFNYLCKLGMLSNMGHNCFFVEKNNSCKQGDFMKKI
ncbi:hypothetical protein [Waddlia chondrophila]|uniref:Competence protein n=1 Tax=Waddlia chondrophila (strain ATCC VR-1470 / WSU 86-1044) TaxID=716544 RepID=D6YWD6_WADCW|nr:hypothetical protein [Waddlia chondrophila]ADI38447.1 hypothetical protein wcw_1090 [Waddlia chondrophila WSU 86-1044]